MVVEQLIHRVMLMILYERSVEEIRALLISEHSDEDIYLAYRAAEIMLAHKDDV